VSQRAGPGVPINRAENAVNAIYQNIFTKFADKFLLARETRASKVKSIKAQIKNLAEGSITQFTKKNQSVVVPSS